MTETSDFETKMLEGMADLRAKMNKLVGVDGNNGDFSRVADRVDAHERYINQQKGASNWIRTVWTAGIAIVASLIGALMARK